jgi:hypothetical protein
MGTTIQAEAREKTPVFAFKPPNCDVNCRTGTTYESKRQKFFRPSSEQIRGARAWVVRVVARRAVEILKAQETPK